MEKKMKSKDIWIERSKKLSKDQWSFLESFLVEDLNELYSSLGRCKIDAVGYPYIQMAIAIKLNKKEDEK